MVDFSIILGYVFGGTSIAGVATGLFFFRENRQLKKNEVKSSDADVEEKQINNDSAQIDLGNKYMESTLEMTQKMQEMITSSDKERNEYWKRQQKSMDDLKKQMSVVQKEIKGVKNETGEIVAFLNGEYKAFKEKHKPVKKPSAIKEKAIEQ